MYLTKACEENKEYLLALSFFIDDLKYLRLPEIEKLLKQYNVKCVNYDGVAHVNLDFKDTMK